MNKRLTAFSILMGLGASLWAQSPATKPSSSAAPLFKFPARASFTVEFGQQMQAKPGGAPARQKTLVKVDVTSTEKMRRLTKLWDDGSRTEDWYIGNYRMIEHPSGQWINMVDATKSSYGGKLSYDASDFSWISIQNRSGEATYKGRPCHRFQMQAPAASSESCEAVIDDQTLLPLILVKGNTTATFTFRQAPQGELQLPPRFEQKWKEIQRR